jgi:hypothetical protein
MPRDLNHGTHGAYNYGCRCAVCVTFQHEYSRKLRGCPDHYTVGNVTLTHDAAGCDWSREFTSTSLVELAQVAKEHERECPHGGSQGLES